MFHCITQMRWLYYMYNSDLCSGMCLKWLVLNGLLYQRQLYCGLSNLTIVGCAEGGTGWFGVGCCWGGGCWFGAGCPGGGTGCGWLGTTGCCGIMGWFAVVTVDMLGWLCFTPGTDWMVGWLVNGEGWIPTGGGRKKSKETQVKYDSVFEKLHQRKYLNIKTLQLKS